MSVEIVRSIINRTWGGPLTKDELATLSTYPEITLVELKLAMQSCADKIKELNENGDKEGLLPAFNSLMAELVKLAEKLAK